MKLLRNSQGIAIIYVTLFLMVLGILFFALGIDIGWMVYVKAQGQAATDASAMAAAAAIPNVNTSGNQTKANELAALFNTDNPVMNQSAGITSSDVVVCGGNPNSPTCPAASLATAGGVLVTRTYNTPLFFTRFLNGAGSTNISVASTAWLGAPAGLGPDLPIALCKDPIGFDPSAPGGPTCNPGTNVQFSPSNSDNAGWWNEADGATANASDCKKMVNGTMPVPYVNIGELVDTNNGEITSCHKEIEDKYAGCNGTQCGLAPDNPLRIACTAILPIVPCTGGAVGSDMPVLGFVAMCITGVNSNPASAAYINGTLNCNITAPESIGGGESFFGIYAARPVLVR
jgi:Flp pilus assembly protein TadG